MATPIASTGSKHHDFGVKTAGKDELRQRIKPVDIPTKISTLDADTRHKKTRFSTMKAHIVNQYGDSSKNKPISIQIGNSAVKVPAFCAENARETHSLIQIIEKTLSEKNLDSDILYKLSECISLKIQHYKMSDTEQAQNSINSLLNKINSELKKIDTWLMTTELPKSQESILEISSTIKTQPHELEESEKLELSDMLMTELQKKGQDHSTDINSELIRQLKRTQLVIAFSPEICHPTVIRGFLDCLSLSPHSEDLFPICYQQYINLTNNSDEFMKRLIAWTSHKSTAGSVECIKLLELLEIEPFTHGKVALKFDKIATKLVETLTHTANVISGKEIPFTSFTPEIQEATLTSASYFAQALFKHGFFQDSDQPGPSFWRSKIDSYIGGLINRISNIANFPSEYDIDRNGGTRILELSRDNLWRHLLNMPELLNETLVKLSTEHKPFEQQDQSERKAFVANVIYAFTKDIAEKTLAIFDQDITGFTHHLLFRNHQSKDDRALSYESESIQLWRDELNNLLSSLPSSVDPHSENIPVIENSEQLLSIVSEKLICRTLILNWVTSLDQALKKELTGGSEHMSYKPCIKKALEFTAKNLNDLRQKEGELITKLQIRTIFTTTITEISSLIAQSTKDHFEKILSAFKTRTNNLSEPAPQVINRGESVDIDTNMEMTPLSEASPIKTESAALNTKWESDKHVKTLLELLLCLYKPAKAPEEEHIDPEDIYDISHFNIQTMTKSQVVDLFGRHKWDLFKDYILHPASLWQFQHSTSRLKSTLAPQECIGINGNTKVTLANIASTNLLTLGSIQIAKEDLKSLFPDHANNIETSFNNEIENSCKTLPSGTVLVDLFCRTISQMANKEDKVRMYDLTSKIIDTYQLHLTDFQSVMINHSIHSGFQPGCHDGVQKVIDWDQCLLDFQNRLCSQASIPDLINQAEISDQLKRNAQKILEVLTQTHRDSFNTHFAADLPPTKELVKLQQHVFALDIAVNHRNSPSEFKDFSIYFDTLNQHIASYSEERADSMTRAYESHDEMMESMDETFEKSEVLLRNSRIQELIVQSTDASEVTVELIKQFNKQVVELSKTGFWKKHLGRHSTFRIYSSKLLELIDEHQAFLPGLFFGTTLASLLLSKEGNSLLKAMQTKMTDAFSTLLSMQGTLQELEVSNPGFYQQLLQTVPAPANMTFTQFQQYGQCYAEFSQNFVAQGSNASVIGTYSSALNQTRDALSVVRHTPSRAPLNGACPVGGNPKFPIGDVHIPNAIAAGFSIGTSLLATFPWVKEIWKQVDFQGRYSSLASLTQDLTPSNTEQLMVQFYSLKHGKTVTAETLHKHQDHRQWILETLDTIVHNPPTEFRSIPGVAANICVGALRYLTCAPLSMLIKQRPHSVDQHYTRNRLSMISQAGKTGLRLLPYNISKEIISVRNPATSSHLAFLFFVKECDVAIALPEKSQIGNRHISEKQLSVFIQSMQRVVTNPQSMTKFTVNALKETYGERIINDMIPEGADLQELEKEAQMHYKALAFRTVGAMTTLFAFGAHLTSWYLYTFSALWKANSLVNNLTDPKAASLANLSNQEFNSLVEEYQSVVSESIDPLNVSDSDQFWFLLYAVRTLTKTAQINLLIAAKASILIGMYCNIRGQSLQMGMSNIDLRALVLTALTLIKDTVSGRIVRAALLSKDQDFLTLASLWDRFDSIAVEYGYSKATKRTFSPPQELVAFSMSKIQETMLAAGGDVDSAHSELSKTFKEIEQIGVKPLCMIADKINAAVDEQITESSKQLKSNSSSSQVQTIQDLAKRTFTDLSLKRVSHGWVPDEATQNIIDRLDQYIASDCEQADLQNPAQFVAVLEHIRSNFTPSVAEALVEQKVFEKLGWGAPKERLERTLRKLDVAKSFFTRESTPESVTRQPFSDSSPVTEVIIQP